jgi:hypothetical protein
VKLYLSTSIKILNFFYTKVFHSINRLSALGLSTGGNFSYLIYTKFFYLTIASSTRLVTDLKKKLTATENKLTDIILEALSLIHQIDHLKNALTK